MINKLTTNAYAKVNLSLDVVKKREDGYHDLKMVMQTVDLCDELDMEITDSGRCEIETNLRFLPTDGGNIACKAAKIFYDCSRIPFTGLKINMIKRIPVCAGLGGGSADGAAILLALRRMHEADIPDSTLLDWALKTGADVPYCMTGKTALVEGVGEKITVLSPLQNCFLVIVKPPLNVSTGSIFAKLNLSKIRHRPDTSGIIEALGSGDLNGISKRMFNVLETVTAAEFGIINVLKGELLDTSALGAVMSGSGSAVFGLYDKECIAREAYGNLKRKYSEVFLCRPLSF